MATAAGAMVAKARRDVVSHFMQSNSVGPESAARWVPDRGIQRRVLSRLVDRGVIVETGTDTYFLDLPAYDRWRRSVRKRAAFALLAVAIIGGAVAAL
ncbi:MAG TPA: hypothetical protein VNS11_05155 [Sphingomicrobium sp.]|nr:hypothetical protein [Sphingomicrobium sp.]